MRFLPALVPVIIMLAVPASSEAEPPPLALKALASFEELEIDDWSYSMTVTSKKGKKVERHVATKPEGQRWELRLIAGQAPSARELEKYRKEKAKDSKRRGEDDEGDDVDLSTLTLINETPDKATFRFRPKADNDKEARFSERVRGTLVVNKDGAWVERFELASTDEIRPIAGVRLNEFNVRMLFRRDSATGEILPVSVTSRIRGQAFLVKSLDDDVVVIFSDFVKAE